MAIKIRSRVINTRAIGRQQLTSIDRSSYLAASEDLAHLQCAIVIHIVTHGHIARERFGAHIPAEAKERNNRMSIARQRISKPASVFL
jgi:hypothetical protein